MKAIDAIQKIIAIYLLLLAVELFNTWFIEIPEVFEGDIFLIVLFLLLVLGLVFAGLFVWDPEIFEYSKGRKG